jgi:alkylation response protein AidB-like acyl-CoA dehydrogenase
MTFDLGLSSDQQAIADMFTAVLARECPPAVVRGAEPLGFHAPLWEAMRAVGAPGMGVAADAGGGGASLAELVVACEALGRAIAPVPLVEHLVAARMAPAPELVDGGDIGAVALRPADSEGRWRLVPAGAVAHSVIGVDGDDLVVVRSEPPGTAPANHACAPLADRSSRDGERTVIGAAADFARALDEWRVLTAATLVGISAASLDLGLRYVRERRQFGVPIGTFQAIKHGLADFPAFIEGARMLVHKAAWVAHTSRYGQLDADDNDVCDPAALAAMAFVFAAEAAATTTDRSLHYHGGYGFAQEYDIQLYFRRARGWANVLGDPSRERLRLADMLWPVGAGGGDRRPGGR